MKTKNSFKASTNTSKHDNGIHVLKYSLKHMPVEPNSKSTY